MAKLAFAALVALMTLISIARADKLLATNHRKPVGAAALPSELFDVDVTTGAISNIRQLTWTPPSQPTVSLFGVVGNVFSRRDGQLYILTDLGAVAPTASAGRVFVVNPSNGVATLQCQLSGMGAGQLLVEGEIAIDPTTGVFYAVERTVASGNSVKDLITINTTTGAVSIVGAIRYAMGTNPSTSDFSGIAFDCAGTLYLFDVNQNGTTSEPRRIIRVDKTTAVISQEWVLNSFFFTQTGGIEFAHASTTLLRVANGDTAGSGGSANPAQLYDFDITTGTLSNARSLLTSSPDPEDFYGVSGIRYYLCRGDTNADYVVDFVDLNAVLGQFSMTGSCQSGDVNDDQVVDFIDLNLVLGGFGTTCSGS